MRIRLLLLTIVCTLSLSANEQSYSTSEYIKLFESDVTITKDRSLQVIETITYVNNKKSNVHGIVREFPTTYRSYLLNTVVGFQVKNILRDGKPEPFEIRSGDNGKRVFIGSAAVSLPPGIYTYQINYTTTRQLGFFDYHDELFWNVTGNGWRLPILQAIARVHLPGTVDPDRLKIQAYTGPYDSYDTHYTSSILAPGVVEFKTTQPLLPREGLTIAVGFPKGLVDPESFISKSMNTISDNIGLLLSLLFLCGTMFASFLYILLNRATQRAGVVIPRFEPPKDMTPGRMRYLYKKAYDAQVFSSDIVYLAVQGYLTINHDKSSGMLSSLFNSRSTGTYTLIKKEPQPEVASQLAQDLFKTNSKVIISEVNRPTLIQVIQAYKMRVEQFVSRYLLTNNWLLTLVRLSFVFLMFLPFILFFTGNISAGSFILIFLSIFAFIIFESLIAKHLQLYTSEGRKLMDEIEGFKMYLTTAEVPRMKYIGTPPTKTPELYEKYLPYAMALGVEQQWSKQFTPIFAQLEQEGHPYQPMWYIGPRPLMFGDITALSSDLRDSFTGAIAASYEPPGSRTGFGGPGSGGGGSGRGGGGGGGGSW